jgi:hypothetical protein
MFIHPQEKGRYLKPLQYRQYLAANCRKTRPYNRHEQLEFLDFIKKTISRLINRTEYF